MNNYKNYGAQYRKNERPHEQKREESQAAVQEEIPVEEQKVEEPAPQPKPVKIYTTVLGPKNVYMRFKANKNSQPINILIPGTRVEVLDQSNPEWTKIRYKDMTGYMMSQFLKKE